MSTIKAIKTEQLQHLVNIIKENYITNLSISDNTITFTRGNGSSGTIKIEDTVYELVDNNNAGLMSPSDKYKLDDIGAITDAEINEICGEMITYASENTKF